MGKRHGVCRLAIGALGHITYITSHTSHHIHHTCIHPSIDPSIIHMDLTSSDEMHLHRALEMRATHIAEQSHFAGPARLHLLPRPRDRGHVLDPVHQYVRMGVSPYEWSELNSSDVQSEALHLMLAVLTIDDAHELEHLRSCSTTMTMMIMMMVCVVIHRRTM